MNVTEPIWRNCHAWPSRIAVVFDGRPTTYQTLRLAAERAGGRLAQAGLARGEVVALAVNNPLAYLVLLLAAVRLGATVTPFKTHWPAPMQAEMLRRHAVRWLISDHEAGAGEPMPEGVRRLDGRALLSTGGNEPPMPPDMPRGGGEAIWHLALSSGTTGAFKSIAQSHARSILAWSLAGDAGSEPDGRVLVAVDLATAMGLGAAMRPLIAGSTLVLLPGFSTRAFFDAMRRDRPTRVVTSTANMGEFVAFAREQVPDSLSVCASLRSVSVTGAAVPPALREAIIARICPRLDIPFGATETGRLATATPETLRARPDSAGRIHPWVQAEAVDDQDRPLAEGQHGVLRFRTPFMGHGYLGDPDATARTFRHGWCYTGDTGSVDRCGYLLLGGRTDHLLNLGGTKLDPLAIERVLDAQSGVRESVAVAVPDRSGGSRLVAAVVADGSFDVAALRAACLDRLGAASVPAVFVAVPALPRNPAGKVLRNDLVTRLSTILEAGARSRGGGDASGADGDDPS